MTANTTNDQQQQPAEPAAGPDDLGKGGRDALAREREARRTAEREAREAREALTARDAADLRRTVALKKGLTDAQAKRLVGDDEETLEKDADELLEAFKVDNRPPGRPHERMRSGAVPGAEPENLGQLADNVMKGW